MEWNDLVLDEYNYFSWNNKNSKDLKMFIISGDQGSNGVNFYNGPSFSNEYSKPQFEKANSNFLGVSFQTQKIKFKVGMFDFTIDEYRKARHWLDEYVISKLVFGFDTKWGYLVKLANIQDSQRYNVGMRNGEETYYTEFDLEFDIQGEPCALYNMAYEFVANKNESTGDQYTFTIKTEDNKGELLKDYQDSLIETPFVCNIGLSNEKNIDKDMIINLRAVYNNESKTLFNVSLTNMSTNANMNLRYDSESGIIYFQFGDSSKKVLSLMSSNVNGKRILNSINVAKFKLPGLLETGINTKEISFILTSTVKNSIIVGAGDKSRETVIDTTSKDHQTTFECFARANVV